MFQRTRTGGAAWKTRTFGDEPTVVLTMTIVHSQREIKRMLPHLFDAVPRSQHKTVVRLTQVRSPTQLWYTVHYDVGEYLLNNAV